MKQKEKLPEVTKSGEINKLTSWLTIILLIIITNCNIAYAQIGILTDTPHSSAALDIESTSKGLLIPRVTLTSDLTSASPITSPATGLLVFNSGSNQPVGIYFWNGTSWISTSFSISNWGISGNTSASVNNNFLGTIDEEHFAIRTYNTERIRIESDGQVVIGATSPFYDSDLFTVQGNATQSTAIKAYSPNYGIYSGAGVISFYGKVDNANGIALLAKNENSDGYGAIITGSGSGAYTLTNHSSALSAHADDGIFCIGHSTSGIGIIAGGSGAGSVSTISVGTGGAFTGYHGVYGKGINSSSGVGIVGIGNNGSTFQTITSGSGGAFTGYHGSYSYSTEETGTGVIGVGNANENSYLMSDGSGGAFTGNTTGVAGWSTDNNGYGVFGRAIGNSSYGVYSDGELGATGTKSFVIDHPLDPKNKILKHYCIESPEVLNMYRGNATLNDDGEAEIILPDYFMDININFSYLLTPIGMPAPNIYIKNEIDENGEFTVSGGEAGQKISWVIYSERNDNYVQQNPASKKVVIEKEGRQKGKYLRPELYNQPENKGVFYRGDGNAESQKAYKTETIPVKEIQTPTKSNH